MSNIDLIAIIANQSSDYNLAYHYIDLIIEEEALCNLNGDEHLLSWNLSQKMSFDLTLTWKKMEVRIMKESQTMKNGENNKKESKKYCQYFSISAHLILSHVRYYILYKIRLQN